MGGTMARGRLRLPLLLSLAMDMVTDMAMEAMEAMARGRLRLLLLLSLAMDMVMDLDLAMVMGMDMAMEAMEAMEAMDIMVTMARDLLMLSPDMDTMVIMDMADMDTTATVMDMAMATMDKFLVISFQS